MVSIDSAYLAFKLISGASGQGTPVGSANCNGRSVVHCVGAGRLVKSPRGRQLNSGPNTIYCRVERVNNDWMTHDPEGLLLGFASQEGHTAKK